MILRLNDQYYVRALSEKDVDGPYPLWFQDQDVNRHNGHGKFFKTEQYFRDFIRSLDREDKVVWAICHDTDGHIGNISLQGISTIHRSAEFAILLGDRRHWGKGVSALAGQALCDHGFRRLNLHRIGCGTAAGNTGMQKLAARLGMRHEGTRRSALFLEGEWVDILEYGVLRDEFLASRTT